MLVYSTHQPAMVVRPFYYVKLFQALGTCILLWQLLSITGQFCGYFIPPNVCAFLFSLIFTFFIFQNLLQLASPVGPCNNFTLYQMPLNATHQPQLKHTHLRQTPLSGAHKAFADQMLSESFPTGPHCFEVGHAQTFWGIDNWHKHTGPFEHTANGLLFPLFFGSLYVIVLVIHTALQVPPDYNVRCRGISAFCMTSDKNHFHFRLPRLSSLCSASSAGTSQSTAWVFWSRTGAPSGVAPTSAPMFPCLHRSVWHL